MTAVAHPLPIRPGARAGAPPVPGCGRVAPARRPGAAQFRRRRVAVAFAFAALVLVGGGAAVGELGGAPLTSPGQAPAARLVAVAETSYVVRPGDTLWEIARALQPSGDVRPLVQQLARQRGGAPLRVGERLVLPPGQRRAGWSAEVDRAPLLVGHQGLDRASREPAMATEGGHVR